VPGPDLPVGSFRRIVNAVTLNKLHALGGQMIRIWHEKPHLRKHGILRMLLEAIGDDGSPIVHPPLTEADQRSFDSTCGLLHRFTTLRRITQSQCTPAIPSSFDKMCVIERTNHLTRELEVP
jgi:hypothetical protein